MASKKELAPIGAANTSLAIADDFFGAHAGEGLDNVTAADMLVPRLTIIQALSPQLKQRDPAFIEGAKVGQICDVGMGQLFPGHVMFLPVYYRKDYLEWAPRASGDGLVAIHPDASILEQTQRNERKQPILPNGNLIAETAQFYGFNLSTPDRRKCFLPMASTQLKKARKWITLAMSEKLRRGDGSEYVAPLFYRTYELGTADESNASGDWSGWTVERGPAMPELDIGLPWQDLGREAADFRDMLIRGDARGDLDHADPLNTIRGEEAM